MIFEIMYWPILYIYFLNQFIWKIVYEYFIKNKFPIFYAL